MHLGGLCDWQHCWCTSGSGDTEPNFQTQPLEKDARTEHSQREQKKSGFSLKLEKLASFRLRVCCSVVKMEFACKEIHEEMCVQDELCGVCLGDHLQYHTEQRLSAHSPCTLLMVAVLKELLKDVP